MSTDLERIITELEEVTARMLATTCWEQTSEFGELSASRHELAVRLRDRQDLDEAAAERIRAVIQTGRGLIAGVMSMKESVLTAGALIDRQRRFTDEIGHTVPGQVQRHQIDISA